LGGIGRGVFGVGLELLFRVCWVFDDLGWGCWIVGLIPAFNAIPDVDLNPAVFLLHSYRSWPTQTTEHIQTIALLVTSVIDIDLSISNELMHPCGSIWRKWGVIANRA
jgi:hypothetical protein